MSEKKLPPGWAWTSLAAIAALKGGITKGHRRGPNETTRLVPYLRVANVQRGYLDLDDVKEIEATEAEIEELRLVPGDVLFNEGGDRDKLGRGWIWNGEIPLCIHQNHVFRARVRAGVIHPKLLSWYGNTLGQQYFLEQGKQTTNLASINMTKLGALPVPVPPFLEQTRIVAEIEKQLSRLEVGISALKRIQANLKRQRAAILKSACEGRLVPTEADLARAEGRTYEPAEVLLGKLLGQRRDQLDERTSTNPGELPVLPDGWSRTSLAQLKLFSRYGPRFSSDDYAPEGVAVLRTSDISDDGRVNLATAPRLALSSEDLARYRVLPGDLLITRTGSLGTLAIFDDDVDAIPGAYLIHYRLVTPSEANRYLLRFFQSPIGQSQLVGGGAGVGRPNLNAPTIESILIPMPPLAEQRRIIGEISGQMSEIDNIAACVDTQILRAQRLRQAVLRQAFEGKLVSQDPNDEPASVLLDRLRAGQPQPTPDVPKRRAPRRRNTPMDQGDSA